MSDLISRKAAIDALKGLPTWWADEGGYYGGAQPPMVALLDPEDAVSAIENLPSAQSEQQWIPCSPETMPKKTGYYLVQYTRKYCRNEMAVAFYSVEEARCDDDYTWEIETFSDIKEVIAWMPLPKPYEER